MPDEPKVRRRKNLLDVKQTAEILGTTERHVRRLVDEKRIHKIKIGGKLRLDPAVLEDRMDENFEPPERS